MRKLFVLLLASSTCILTGLIIPSFRVNATDNYVTPVFLGDVNSEVKSSQLKVVGQVGEVIIFQPKYDEVWRSDGTANGTYKLANIDLVSAEKSSINMGGFLYFVGGGASNITAALWRTNGTLVGTTIVKHLDTWTERGPSRIAVVNSFIYLYSGEYGAPIWKSDGTASGTSQLLIPELASNARISELHGFNDRLLISTEAKLFSYEVSSGNVSVLLDVPGYHYLGRNLITVGESFVLLGLSSHVYRISLDWSVSLLANIGSSKFFQCGLRQCFWTSGNQLASTDGTSAGTAILKSFVIQTTDIGLVNDTPAFLGNGYFAIDSSVLNSRGVWESDGSAGGTRRVSDEPSVQGLAATPDNLYIHGETSLRRWNGANFVNIRSNFVDISGSSLTESGFMSEIQSKVFFTPTTRTTGKELWITSDSSDSASLVRDISIGSEDNDTCSQRIAFNDGDVMAVGYANATTGGLVRYSARTQSSSLIEAEEVVGRYRQLSYSNLARLNNFLLFVADANPWVTDGGVGNATMLKRVTNSVNAEIGPFVTFSSKSFFFAGDGTINSPPTAGYIWQTDGTTAGTVQVTEAANRHYQLSNGELFFHKSNSQQTVGLWKKNLSTNAVTEVMTGSFRIYPVNSGVFLLGSSSFLYFDSATSEVRTVESWSAQNTDSDGIAIGGVEEPGIRALGYGVFYTKNTPQDRYKFSDGTLNGTRSVVSGQVPSVSTPFDDSKLMLFDEQGQNGFEPSVLNSRTGTKTILKDASPGAANSYYQDLGHDSLAPAVINGKLYFDMIVHDGGPYAYNFSGSSEIWESDGTPEGTRRISDFASISDGPRFTHCLFASGDFLYFGAFNDSFGRELWAIDTRTINPVANQPTSHPLVPPNSGQEVTSPVQPSTTSASGNLTDLSQSQVEIIQRTGTINAGTGSVGDSAATSRQKGVVLIPRPPSKSFSKDLSISLNSGKVTFVIQPPAAPTKNAQVASYLVQLKPKKGKVISKLVAIKSSNSSKYSTTLKRNVVYQLSIVAVQKSGKRFTWKGPSLVGK